MQTETKNLLQDATNAKMKYMAGIITYDECVKEVQKYIDHCNEVAKRIAKEHGMKPKLMSARAWMR